MMSQKSLSIIIPVYNEEEAVRGTVERCLTAIPTLQHRAKLDWVEIIVVSDGSTDRTVDIAQALVAENPRKNAGGRPELQLISYQHNRGYGAAIKTGFQAAAGSYMGFLDGDGTCDPLIFADLLLALYEQQADIAIGSRMHAESKMPLIRNIGNTLFARLLAWLSGKDIGDSASGMRVLTKGCMEWILLMPDGLHFTPAMSAKAAFDSDITLIEIPMPYQERQGKSKLHVFKDGLRFLSIILQTAYLYIPFRFFAVSGLILIVLAIGLAFPRIIDYVKTIHVEEDAFYRLFVSTLLFLIGVNSIMFGLIAHNFSCLLRNRDYHATGSVSRILNRLWGKVIAPGGVTLILLGIYVNRDAFVSYALYQEIYLHWSRVVFGGLLFLTGVTALFYVMVYQLLDMFYQQKTLRGELCRDKE